MHRTHSSFPVIRSHHGCGAGQDVGAGSHDPDVVICACAPPLIGDIPPDIPGNMLRGFMFGIFIMCIGLMPL